MAMTQNTTVDEPGITSHKPYGPLDANALNLPNCITVSRLVLSFVLFAMISYGGLWISSAVVFAIAAATDAVDGYLARRYGMVTTLGRILDPSHEEDQETCDGPHPPGKPLQDLPSR